MCFPHKQKEWHDSGKKMGHFRKVNPNVSEKARVTAREKYEEQERI